MNQDVNQDVQNIKENTQQFFLNIVHENSNISIENPNESLCMRIKIYNASDLKEIRQTLSQRKIITSYRDSAIINGKNEPLVKTILDFANSSHNSNSLNSSLAIVNFAHPTQKCPEYIKGKAPFTTNTKELEMCYHSNYYFQLCKMCKTDFLTQEFYEYNKNNQNNGAYNDIIFELPVTFFRDEEYNLITNPFTCMVYSTSNISLKRLKESKNLSLTELKNEAKQLFRSRARKVLDVLIYNHVQHIILTPIYNSIDIWMELLYNEGYQKYFHTIFINS